jgi:hypothetical protein
MPSGPAGQILTIPRAGNVPGALGNGSGRGPGQFIEASYFAYDSQGNPYPRATTVGRITKFVAPKK